MALGQIASMEGSTCFLDCLPIKNGYLVPDFPGDGLSEFDPRLTKKVGIERDSAAGVRGELAELAEL